MGQEKVFENKEVPALAFWGEFCMGEQDDAGLHGTVDGSRKMIVHGPAVAFAWESVESSARGPASPPNLRLHLTRLSCAVVKVAGPATEVCGGGSSPQPPRR